MNDNKNLARTKELIEKITAIVITHTALDHAYYQAPSGSVLEKTMDKLMDNVKDDYTAAKNDLLALVAALAGEELDAQEEGE